MAVVNIRGSTADGSGGVQVAGSVYEGTSGPTVPWGVVVGNKETITAVSRTGITAADAPTGGDLTTGGFGSTGLLDVANCLNVLCRATCSVASATLVGRLVFYDSASACLGISTSITFVSDATLRLGNATGDFVSSFTLVDVGASRNARFFVDTVSAGSWSIYLRPV